MTLTNRTELPRVCVQHYACGAARRAGLSATVSTCSILNAANTEIETARLRTPCHRIVALRFLRAIYRQVYCTIYLYIWECHYFRVNFKNLCPCAEQSGVSGTWHAFGEYT